jgi:ABC-2 type transport system permease protein
MPIEVLPPALQKVATLLPTYHFGQLVLGVIGVRSGPIMAHLEVLVGFVFICLGIARLGFQRDEGKLYG